MLARIQFIWLSLFSTIAASALFALYVPIHLYFILPISKGWDIYLYLCENYAQPSWANGDTFTAIIKFLFSAIVGLAVPACAFLLFISNPLILMLLATSVGFCVALPIAYMVTWQVIALALNDPRFQTNASINAPSPTYEQIEQIDWSQVPFSADDLTMLQYDPCNTNPPDVMPWPVRRPSFDASALPRELKARYAALITNENKACENDEEDRKVTLWKEFKTTQASHGLPYRWQVVPESEFVQNHSQLSAYLTSNHGLHPVTQERITHPKPCEKEGTKFETRFHWRFVDKASNGPKTIELATLSATPSQTLKAMAEEMSLGITASI